MGSRAWDRRRDALLLAALALTVIIGVLCRFHGILRNQFFFYDEGYWLLYSLSLLSEIESDPPRSPSEFISALGALFHLSLATAKGLWAYLVSLRVFLFGSDAWYFARLVSAVSGVLTLCITWLFATRWFESKRLGLLTVAVLAVLPSHVYYSRLGLQESLGALFFLGAFHLYVHRESRSSALVAGALLAATYLCNYRMVIGPLLLVAFDLHRWWSTRQRPPPDRLLILFYAFVAIALGIGMIDDGANLRANYYWFAKQAATAGKASFDAIDLLSYPYFLFALEGTLFGLFFFANLVLLRHARRGTVDRYADGWVGLFPFLLVCALMLGFAFVENKAPRSLSCALPFVAIAIVNAFAHLRERFTRSPQRAVLLCAVALLLLSGSVRSVAIVQMRTDYAAVMDDLVASGTATGVVATQEMVLRVLAEDRLQVISPWQLRGYREASARGFRFLVIDPQAYVQSTASGAQLDTQLTGLLGYATARVEPTAVHPHFDPLALERFAFEHNSNLRRSLAFLERSGDRGFGRIYVYDLAAAIEALERDVRAGTWPDSPLRSGAQPVSVESILRQGTAGQRSR